MSNTRRNEATCVSASRSLVVMLLASRVTSIRWLDLQKNILPCRYRIQPPKIQKRQHFTEIEQIYNTSIAPRTLII
jgi:hypothetical protein